MGAVGYRVRRAGDSGSRGRADPIQPIRHKRGDHLICVDLLDGPLVLQRKSSSGPCGLSHRHALRHAAYGGERDRVGAYESAGEE